MIKTNSLNTEKPKVSFAPEVDKELFLTRDANSSLQAACQEQIDTWASKIPFSPIKKFSQETTLVRAEELATYHVTVDTQIEKRWLEDHEVSYQRQSLPAVAVPKSAINPWNEVFISKCDFQPHRQSNDLMETRQAYSCTGCGATGRVQCDSCAGRGKVSCSSCGGSGRCRCGSCSGRGQISNHRSKTKLVNCPFCAGRGSQGGNSNFTRCVQCYGRGTQIADYKEEYFTPCGSCGSSGQVTCSSCRGSGQVTCSNCRGSGQVTCSRCEGTGRLMSYVSCEQEEEPRQGNQVYLPELPKFTKAAHPLSRLDGPVVFVQDERNAIQTYRLEGAATHKLREAITECRKEHGGRILRQRFTITRCTLLRWDYTFGGKTYNLFLSPAHSLVEDVGGPIQAEITKIDTLAEESYNLGLFEQAFSLNIKGLCMDEPTKAERQLRGNILFWLYLHYLTPGLLIFGPLAHYMVNYRPATNPTNLILGILALLLGPLYFVRDFGVSVSHKAYRYIIGVIMGFWAFASAWPGWGKVEDGYYLPVFALATLLGMRIYRRKELARKSGIEKCLAQFPTTEELEKYVEGLKPSKQLTKKATAIVFGVCLVFVARAAYLASTTRGEKDAGPAAATAAAPAPVAAAPTPAAPRVIEITAILGMLYGEDTMKFNLTTIEAKVGETIKIVLTNNGTLPKEAMGHNLVVLKPGSDGAAFCAAAMTAKATEYIPESLKSQVVAATALLGPKKSEEIILKDLRAGEYPYVCSFPAHFIVGMKGILIVK